MFPRMGYITKCFGFLCGVPGGEDGRPSLQIDNLIPGLRLLNRLMASSQVPPRHPHDARHPAHDTSFYPRRTLA